MSRRATGLNRLLALLLLAQAVLAPALCLAARGVAHAGGLMEICTADGIRLVALDAAGGAHGGAEDPAPAGGEHRGACLACHALPQGLATPEPVLPAPAWIALGSSFLPAGPPAPPPAIRGPPQGARAPPILS